MFKLYHQKTLIGTVLDADANGFSMHGIVELSTDAEPFKPIFAFFQDRSIPKDMEPPFPEELLENWFMEKDGGDPEEIGIPGVFEMEGKTHIMWRYY